MAPNEQNLCCLRCGVEMEFSGREKFQLGEESYHSGLLAVMTAESMLLDIYTCPECGKVEFFQPRARKTAAGPKPNWTCPECGTYNSGRVQTCQGCGVSRAWLEEQRRKE